MLFEESLMWNNPIYYYAVAWGGKEASGTNQEDTSL